MPGTAPTRPKKPATPIPFLKRPALARGFVGFSALNFAAMQLVATLFLPNGLFAILAAGPAFIDRVFFGAGSANPKKPAPFPAGGQLSKSFFFLSWAFGTCPPAWGKSAEVRTS